jgi:hypothetical protein
MTSDAAQGDSAIVDLINSWPHPYRSRDCSADRASNTGSVTDRSTLSMPR